ncbi:MAG: hypothetical protein ABEL51_07045 [Salinibacter sp.]
MSSIGFRASADTVYYGIIEEDGSFNVARLPRPKSMGEPAALRYLRTNIRDIISEFEAQSAGIRMIEPQASGSYPERRHVEGVILELLANSPVQSYFEGPIATIAKWLGKDRNEIKPLRNGETLFLNYSDWSADYRNEEREAILTAAAAMGMHNERQ